MGFFEFVGESLKGVTKGVQKGRDAAVRSSEKMLRISRLKMDVQELREEKERKMKEVAHKVYELYTQNALKNPELLQICQDIKTIQWQIDERWTEINHLNTQK
ncbi:MAG: hypothetical protein AB1758_35125 [Candidatus Eremiobacterota bacterium]